MRRRICSSPRSERAAHPPALPAGVVHHPAHPHPLQPGSHDALLALRCCRGCAPSRSPSPSTIGVMHCPPYLPTCCSFAHLLTPPCFPECQLSATLGARVHDPPPIWTLSFARVVRRLDRGAGQSGRTGWWKRKVGGMSASFCAVQG